MKADNLKPQTFRLDAFKRTPIRPSAISTVYGDGRKTGTKACKCFGHCWVERGVVGSRSIRSIVIPSCVVCVCVVAALPKDGRRQQSVTAPAEPEGINRDRTGSRHQQAVGVSNILKKLQSSARELPCKQVPQAHKCGLRSGACFQCSFFTPPFYYS